jgi:hypothetical protein
MALQDIEENLLKYRAVVKSELRKCNKYLKAK